MSQAANFGVPATGPSTPTNYAARDNASFSALLSSHSGPAEPSYRVRGTIWEDTSTGQFKRYTGSAWRVIDGDMPQATVRGRNAGAGTGAPQDLTMSQLASMLKFSGTGQYQKFPSGMIVQWGSQDAGTISGTNVYINVVFPIAFPSGVIMVLAGGWDLASAWNASYYSVPLVYAKSATGCQIYFRGNEFQGIGSTGPAWIAIGA